MNPKSIPRRCGASVPDVNADAGWHWCYHPANHAGYHEDDTLLWEDRGKVEVHTIVVRAAVPHHEHAFVEGQDTCVGERECSLTWGAHLAQRAWWEAGQADICSFCGHAEHCHTTSLPEEGRKDYCTECDGAAEFHAMDEEPKRPEVTRERLLEAVRGLLGPEVPQSRLEAAVDRMRGMLALTDSEAATSPQEPPQARLDAMRARVDDLEDRKGVRPLVYDEPTGGGDGHDDMIDEDAPPQCAVPGCGHEEGVHFVNHCEACHRENDDHGKGKCVHYFFSPMPGLPDLEP